VDTCKAAEEEVNPGTLGNRICRRKCGWQASGTAGGRWRRLLMLKTELDGVKWSVAHAAVEVRRHKS